MNSSLSEKAIAKSTAQSTGNADHLRWFAPLAVGIFVFISCQAICVAYKVPEYLVPSPLRIAQALSSEWGVLWKALLVTLKITALALLCAVATGVAIAFLLVQSRIIEASLFPYAILLQVTPVVAIAPLIIIWVKAPTPALVICATLVALFPIISNTILGLRSVHPGRKALKGWHESEL